MLWVLDWIEPPQRERKATVLRIGLVEVATEAAEVEPMEVVLADIGEGGETGETEGTTEGTTEVAPAPTATAIRRSGEAGATQLGAESERSGTGTGTGTGPESETGGGYGRLSMRRPDLGMGGVVLHEDPDARRAEVGVEPTGKLAPSGGGTYRTQRPGFQGQVGRDGKVSFKDKPAFSVKLKLPNPIKVARRAAKGLEDWQRDPWAQVKDAERDWTSGLEVKDYTKHLDKKEGEDDKADHGEVATVPVLGGSTELTDWVMRKLGEDPYQSDKLLWMDETREERAQIGRVHRERELKRSDEIMRRHLDRLWARADLGLKEKKVALFELWDDGAEDGDAKLVEAANRARTLVIGFVRARLPRGSAGAYTAAELDALNRRRTSRARFAPYE
ncbi:MAG: hypothetical protein K8M05_35590 [Deltaproteobacteria bacterium]|nr:hypothetical protein [Kofleriaceae bacterium]